MELTKKERHMVYVIALKRFKSCSVGLCRAIYEASQFVNFYCPFAYEYMDAYPEIYKHRPKFNENSYWWDLDEDGYNQRIEVLKSAIKETRTNIFVDIRIFFLNLLGL